DVGTYAGIGPGFGSTVFRPLIVRGRRPVADRADEVTINQALADLTGLDVGDHTRYLGPTGIDQPVTIVGIHRTPLDIGPNGGAAASMGTPAFMARWFPGVAKEFGPSLRPAVAVRLRPGVNVQAAVHDLAETVPDAGILGPAAL